MAWLELSDKSVNQKDEEEQQSSWRKLILRHGIVEGPVQYTFFSVRIVRNISLCGQLRNLFRLCFESEVVS